MPSAGGVHVIIRALCRWHFQPVGGPEYCRACRDDGLHCARGEPGANGRLCPYRDHALISREEHEAWDVLLACQGQLRLAPSGQMIGIDMNAALKIGAARGCDLAVLSELLPAAEAGLVDAVYGDGVRGETRCVGADGFAWLDVESRKVLVRSRARNQSDFPERTMSRLPDLRYDEMTAEQQRVHDEIKAGPRGKVVGPLKVWLYSAELADRAQRLGAYVRYNSTLPAQLSELAILVTARLWKADFEWHSHVDPARGAGIPDAVIEAIRLGAEPALEDARSRAVYAVARELHEARALSDETYAHAEAELGRQGLVDLVGILGYYTLISMTLKAFDVSTADGARPFED